MTLLTAIFSLSFLPVIIFSGKKLNPGSIAKSYLDEISQSVDSLKRSSRLSNIVLFNQGQLDVMKENFDSIKNDWKTRMQKEHKKQSLPLIKSFYPPFFVVKNNANRYFRSFVEEVRLNHRHSALLYSYENLCAAVEVSDFQQLHENASLVLNVVLDVFKNEFLKQFDHVLGFFTELLGAFNDRNLSLSLGRRRRLNAEEIKERSDNIQEIVKLKKIITQLLDFKQNIMNMKNDIVKAKFSQVFTFLDNQSKTLEDYAKEYHNPYFDSIQQYHKDLSNIIRGVLKLMTVVNFKRMRLPELEERDSSIVFKSLNDDSLIKKYRKIEKGELSSNDLVYDFFGWLIIQGRSDYMSLNEIKKTAFRHLEYPVVEKMFDDMEQ
ncbi:hypothetical protein ROZALSC1DRAFT_26928 [Rozella allomycis CSF55]|uniref:Uncharacterized protein n=1 Tax=Rozella allomycis (strain CSF55) TaxID=988480 RepID=A0A075AV10_ROZAC|nr:hypothetical protein O9G_001296 [Rozella allomycis CSF55]RKP21673.1 hypothetical protein ROZALSC1DRAFT_26928 [Rozella allomycis CSF55]|eukprot:EPZ32394.1 hypothetical protein O9G_001296 [Rozella allomycis CSF55]